MLRQLTLSGRVAYLLSILKLGRPKMPTYEELKARVAKRMRIAYLLTTLKF